MNVFIVLVFTNINISTCIKKQSYATQNMYSHLHTKYTHSKMHRLTHPKSHNLTHAHTHTSTRTPKNTIRDTLSLTWPHTHALKTHKYTHSPTYIATYNSYRH